MDKIIHIFKFEYQLFSDKKTSRQTSELKVTMPLDLTVLVTRMIIPP